MTLETYCVTAYPADFPMHYAVRPMFCARDFRGDVRSYAGHVACLYDQAEDIEDDMLALGLAWTPRFENDAPHILGAWL